MRSNKSSTRWLSSAIRLSVSSKSTSGLTYRLRQQSARKGGASIFSMQLRLEIEKDTETPDELWEGHTDMHTLLSSILILLYSHDSSGRTWQIQFVSVSSRTSWMFVIIEMDRNSTLDFSRGLYGWSNSTARMITWNHTQLDNLYRAEADSAMG
jgi:hypothetical protein